MKPRIWYNKGTKSSSACLRSSNTNQDDSTPPTLGNPRVLTKVSLRRDPFSNAKTGLVLRYQDLPSPGKTNILHDQVFNVTYPNYSPYSGLGKFLKWPATTPTLPVFHRQKDDNATTLQLYSLVESKAGKNVVDEFLIAGDDLKLNLGHPSYDRDTGTLSNLSCIALDFLMEPQNLLVPSVPEDTRKNNRFWFSFANFSYKELQKFNKIVCPERLPNSIIPYPLQISEKTSAAAFSKDAECWFNKFINKHDLIVSQGLYDKYKKSDVYFGHMSHFVYATDKLRNIHSLEQYQNEEVWKVLTEDISTGKEAMHAAVIGIPMLITLEEAVRICHCLDALVTTTFGDSYTQNLSNSPEFHHNFWDLNEEISIATVLRIIKDFKAMSVDCFERMGKDDFLEENAQLYLQANAMIHILGLYSITVIPPEIFSLWSYFKLYDSFLTEFSSLLADICWHYGIHIAHAHLPFKGLEATGEISAANGESSDGTRLGEIMLDTIQVASKIRFERKFPSGALTTQEQAAFHEACFPKRNDKNFFLCPCTSFYCYCALQIIYRCTCDALIQDLCTCIPKSIDDCKIFPCPLESQETPSSDSNIFILDHQGNPVCVSEKCSSKADFVRTCLQTTIEQLNERHPISKESTFPCSCESHTQLTASMKPQMVAMGTILRMVWDENHPTTQLMNKYWIPAAKQLEKDGSFSIQPKDPKFLLFGKQLTVEDLQTIALFDSNISKLSEKLPENWVRETKFWEPYTTMMMIKAGFERSIAKRLSSACSDLDDKLLRVLLFGRGFYKGSSYNFSEAVTTFFTQARLLYDYALYQRNKSIKLRREKWGRQIYPLLLDGSVKVATDDASTIPADAERSNTEGISLDIMSRWITSESTLTLEEFSKRDKEVEKKPKVLSLDSPTPNLESSSPIADAPISTAKAQVDEEIVPPSKKIDACNTLESPKSDAAESVAAVKISAVHKPKPKRKRKTIATRLSLISTTPKKSGQVALPAKEELHAVSSKKQLTDKQAIDQEEKDHDELEDLQSLFSPSPTLVSSNSDEPAGLDEWDIEIERIVIKPLYIDDIATNHTEPFSSCLSSDLETYQTVSESDGDSNENDFAKSSKPPLSPLTSNLETDVACSQQYDFDDNETFGDGALDVFAPSCYNVSQSQEAGMFSTDIQKPMPTVAPRKTQEMFNQEFKPFSARNDFGHSIEIWGDSVNDASFASCEFRASQVPARYRMTELSVNESASETLTSRTLRCESLLRETSDIRPVPIRFNGIGWPLPIYSPDPLSVMAWWSYAIPIPPFYNSY